MMEREYNVQYAQNDSTSGIRYVGFERISFIFDNLHVYIQDDSQLVRLRGDSAHQNKHKNPCKHMYKSVWFPFFCLYVSLLNKV